jgi:hypothetical protein
MSIFMSVRRMVWCPVRMSSSTSVTATPCFQLVDDEESWAGRGEVPE